MKSITIPAGAEEILKQLNCAGYGAYLVGGCVRDCLMGRQPHDWDICTSATPTEMLYLFRHDMVIETGLKHGTITVVKDDGGYEVTTFRVDGEYTDGRHPDEVRFVRHLEEDLARRDFTINAIAMDADRNLYDPFGGAHDIVNRKIRCVGCPVDRFREDGLRILRAMRFASTLGFTIDYETWNAIHLCRELLTKISAERINSELCKLLAGDNVGNVLLAYTDVITTIIPELAPCVGFNQNNYYHIRTVWNHIVDTVERAPKEVRLPLLLHDIAKPNCYTEDERGGHFYGHPKFSAIMADDILRRLKFDNATRESTVELVLYHDAELVARRGAVKRWLNRIGKEQFFRLLDMQKADAESHTPGTMDKKLGALVEVRELAANILAEGECFTVKDLAIDGFDVMTIKGLKPGPEVGAILKYALELVINEQLPNTDEALEKWLIELKEVP